MTAICPHCNEMVTPDYLTHTYWCCTACNVCCSSEGWKMSSGELSTCSCERYPGEVLIDGKCERCGKYALIDNEIVILNSEDQVHQPAHCRVTIPEGYERWAEIVKDALHQTAHGKGKERHACGEPFDQQFICTTARRHGLGYATGQAAKKLDESHRLDPEAAYQEILGAINYAVAAGIVLKERMQGVGDA